jgi:hypothetical protein
MSVTPEDQIDDTAFTEVIQQLEALRSLMTVLREDVERFRSADDGAGQRALVRAALAYIEGTSFGFRSLALHLAPVRNVALTVGETLMARETTYALNGKGQVEERMAHSTPLANLRFALSIFAKVTGAAYEFPASDSNFEKLQRVQGIRDRLTHPRTGLALDVSPEEQALVLTAVDWIVDQQTNLMVAFAFRLYSGLERFVSGVEALPRTEGGGYSVAEVAAIFSRELTEGNPISLDEAGEWFSDLLKAHD